MEKTLTILVTDVEDSVKKYTVQDVLMRNDSFWSYLRGRQPIHSRCSPLGNLLDTTKGVTCLNFLFYYINIFPFH